MLNNDILIIVSACVIVFLLYLVHTFNNFHILAIQNSKLYYKSAVGAQKKVFFQSFEHFNLSISKRLKILRDF